MSIMTMQGFASSGDVEISGENPYKNEREISRIKKLSRGQLSAAARQLFYDHLLDDDAEYIRGSAIIIAGKAATVEPFAAPCCTSSAPATGRAWVSSR
ncbi:hypothetical protein [Arthrobacter sp. LAPM80]|uniref:hypothetical protein n=1 Tax=Arthrobacter sp. LAPM80 TaxID=3141788 RepID=UPI00398B4071